MRAFENMHKWVISVPFILLIYFLTLMHVPDAGRYLGFIETGSLMLTTMLFALRDGFVIHFVFRAGGGRNAAFKLVFYYVLVYLLLPTLHFSTLAAKGTASVWFWVLSIMKLGAPPTAVPDMVKTAGFYFPTPFADFTIGVLPAFVEAALAGLALFLLIRAQNKRNALATATPSAV